MNQEPKPGDMALVWGMVLIILAAWAAIYVVGA